MKIIDHTKCDTCMSNLMQYLTKMHCIEIKVLYKYLELFSYWHRLQKTFEAIVNKRNHNIKCASLQVPTKTEEINWSFFIVKLKL